MFGINDNDQTNNPPAGGNNQTGNPPALPASPFMDSPMDSSTPSGPAVPASAPALNDRPAGPPMTGGSAPPASNDLLVGLKEQALSSLAPLVNHLDQTPEEKFKTTMMLIQASDNSSLVKEAYEAANQITDEKARAQALLDVINEINYFTQNDKAEAKP